MQGKKEGRCPWHHPFMLRSREPIHWPPSPPSFSRRVPMTRRRERAYGVMLNRMKIVLAEHDINSK